MAFSIKHLRVFVTVAQAGSFVEAARLLHLTSAALSVVVKTLEEEAGFLVFERTTRSVRLTAEGASLLPLAVQMLKDHQALSQSIEDIRLKKTGRVRIATTQLLSCTIVPPALTQFRALWPDIEVVQVPALYDNFQDLLMRREVDIGIGPERLCDGEIGAVPLFASRLHLVCSTKHRFAQRKSLKWKDLQGENVFLVDKRGATWLARDADYQVLFERTVDVGHFTTALALASENEGVVFSPKFTKKLLPPYGLVMIPLTQPQAHRQFMLFQNLKAPETTATQRLRDHLLASFSAIT